MHSCKLANKLPFFPMLAYVHRAFTITFMIQATKRIKVRKIVILFPDLCHCLALVSCNVLPMS